MPKTELRQPGFEPGGARQGRGVTLAEKIFAATMTTGSQYYVRVLLPLYFCLTGENAAYMKTGLPCHRFTLLSPYIRTILEPLFFLKALILFFRRESLQLLSRQTRYRLIKT